ncbi:MAG: winged helix-turn-helix domain-containing protein [Candidatus Omnitrophica bacterium]|nr:winged helix-turn-helix domain-containing protein [Candidatus Omnitrophota bacterium]MCF7876806.1 winged helix-turn-helix domain-containing protein [Candidatus Omnitrophota bacterium]MCF7878101.1 winged helix-turn-helix domain-containing protein [Candidatus Omnitrophota bacterium]MCF7893249.1 winged helix-turn-helix domain-containing protein [Candidatus Omnitrophota bacterium]
MVTLIGIVAGEIWNFLDDHGETSLDSITNGIDKPEKLILMSLGWLARENHIIVTKKNNGYRIKLNEKKKKWSQKKSANSK